MISTQNVTLAWGAWLKYIMAMEAIIMVFAMITFCLSITSAVQIVTDYSPLNPAFGFDPPGRLDDNGPTEVSVPFFFEATMPGISILFSVIILTPLSAIIYASSMTVLWFFFLISWYTCAFGRWDESSFCDTNWLFTRDVHHRPQRVNVGWYNVNIAKLIFRLMMLVTYAVYVALAVFARRNQRLGKRRSLRTVSEPSRTISEPPNYLFANYQGRWDDAPPTIRESERSFSPDLDEKLPFPCDLEDMDVEYGIGATNIIDSATIDGPARYGNDTKALTALADDEKGPKRGSQRVSWNS